MTNQNKQTKYILIFIGILLVAGIILYFGVIQTQFVSEPGFKAYGESGVGITNLNLVSDSGQACGGSGCIDTNIYSSTYWDITTTGSSGQGVSNRPEAQPPSGDDFDIYLSGGLSQEYGGYTIEYQTKNEFGKGRDFRTEFYAISGEGQVATFQISLVTPSSVINLQNKEINGNALLEIKSSPIVDIVEVYYNGLLVQTLTISEPFKVKLKSPAILGSKQVDVWFSGKTGIKNSAYKDVYNCQVDPDEQYYSYIFKGPIIFSKNDLQNFHKWCLDEFPVTIYTNAGPITDQTAILGDGQGHGGLENGQSLVVPNGQLYQITYIGEKKSLTTPCELNELLVNGNTCTAKTVLEIDLICEVGGNCPDGGPQIGNETIPTDNLIITTEPVDYIVSDIQTHQFLANNSKIRFTHYVDDFSSSPSSFNLFGTTFISEGIISPFGVEPKRALFSFVNKISGNPDLGVISILDEFNKVKLTRVELQDPVDVGIGDSQKFLAEWTFDIDTSFLVLSYDEQTKEIIVTNNYYPVNGHFSFIKTDNSGTQTNQDIQTSFPLGETRVSIGDTIGLVSIAGRPYFDISTPDSNYILSGSNAITISDLEEAQIIVTIADEPATPPIQLENIQGGDKAITSKKEIKISTGTIAGIVGGLIVGVSIFLIIKGLRRLRIKRRR